MCIAIATDTCPSEINGMALTVSALAHGLIALAHAVGLVHPRNFQVLRDQFAAPALLEGITQHRTIFPCAERCEQPTT